MDEEFERYHRFREMLVERESDGRKDLDGRLLWASGGALALSWAATTWMAQYLNVAAVWLVILGWVFLLVAILLIILSLHWSVTVHESYRECLDAVFGDYDTYAGDPWGEARRRHEKEWRNAAIDWCNRLGISSLILGLICTSIFVGINLAVEDYRSTQMANLVAEDEGRKVTTEPVTKPRDDPREERGRKPPSPPPPKPDEQTGESR